MKDDEKKALKVSILALCKSQLDETVRNLKHEMDDCQQMANDYGQPRDRYDAFRSQLLRKRDIFAQQMNKANQELVVLNKINPAEINDKVSFGSVVLTSEMNFFVSVGMGRVTLEDKSFMCISPAVPVYKAMAGAISGAEVFFNGKTITLDQVF